MKRFPLIVILSIASVWVVVAVLFYISNTSSINTQSVHQELMGITESNAAAVRYNLTARTVSLQAITGFIEEADNYTSIEALSQLEQLSAAEGYEHVAIDTVTGYSYTSKGHQFVKAVLGYADKIKDGRPFIIDVQGIQEGGPSYVSIVVPIQRRQGPPQAALRCALATGELGKMFNQSLYSSGGFFHLVDGNGNFVATNSMDADSLYQNNYFDIIQNLDFDAGYTPNHILSAFTRHDSGFIQYRSNGLARFAYFVPVGINNWVMTVVIPEERVAQQSSLHTQNALILMLQLFALLLFVAVYIFINERAAKRRALLNEKCFTVLAEQTGKIIFEWDFADGKITCRSNFAQIFGRDVLTKSATAEPALTAQAVHPNDAEDFRQIFATIKRGQAVTDVRFRIKDSTGAYRWCALSGVVIKNEKQKPFKAIGTVEMIDERVKNEETLRQKAETDSLTGLYNKATTEYMIRELLKEGLPQNLQYALMIIDIDNFKDVNDRLGHKYGDSVISSLAEMLRSTFRSDDIVGRVGGDEFFVLLKNIRSTALVRTKAGEVCDLFRNTYIENGAMVNISASIGISLCPQHGKDLDSLYVNADIALYSAKAKGKDTYVIYSGETAHCYISSRTTIDTP